MEVIKNSRKLVKKIYNLVNMNFPKDENFGLTSQIKRAVISVSLNLVEGNVFIDKRKLTHFERSLGSLMEVKECYILAVSLDYIKIDEVIEKEMEVLRRQIIALIKSLRSSLSTPQS